MDSFEDFAAKRASSNATCRVGTKDKGNGKAKPNKSAASLGLVVSIFKDSLISHVSACISRMLGGHTGRQVDGCKTFGQNLRDDIIDVFVHLPKTDALNWLRRGAAHRALLAKDIANLPDAKDLQKVWIAPACLLIVNSLGPLFALVTAGRLGRARAMKEESKALCSRTCVLYLRDMLSFALTMY